MTMIDDDVRTVWMLDIWSWQEARQSSVVHNVSTHHYVVGQSTAVLLHRGLQEVRYISTGLYFNFTSHLSLPNYIRPVAKLPQQL